jgi:cell division protein FtsI/penicillin-binding protein 2
MKVRGRRAFGALLIALALSGSLIAVAAPNLGTAPGAAQALQRAPALATGRTQRLRAPIAGFDPLGQRQEGERLVSDLPEGRRAELTLDPGLQAHVAAVLRNYEVPYGALVALEPATGRVLAYVSHSSANPDAGDLARDPSPPAASVFKVVTGAALIDAGVQPSAQVCFGGGMSRLVASDLVDDPRRDRACASLSDAMAGSINTVFAKLSDRKLDRAVIERYAQAFGFGHALPFDAPARPSPAEVPDDRLELARTAAGFWHMHMSPLHGALIAATFANGGSMPRPFMIERVVDGSGRELYAGAPERFRQVISRSTAKAVGQMMLGTVAHGTARSAFHDPRGRPFLPGIAVAGKTGSLSSERPYRAYSWWVGYAPEAAPEIALAALVVNTPKWRIKASYLAREALRYQLVERKARKATPATAPASAATPGAPATAPDPALAPAAPASAPKPALAPAAPASAPKPALAPAAPK